MVDRIYFVSNDYDHNHLPNTYVTWFDPGPGEPVMNEVAPNVEFELGGGYIDVHPVTGEVLVASSRFYRMINPFSAGAWADWDSQVTLYDDTALYKMTGDLTGATELVHDSIAHQNYNVTGFRGSELTYPWSRYQGMNQPFFWGEKRVLGGIRLRPWAESDWREGEIAHVYTDAGTLDARHAARYGIRTRAEYEYNQANCYIAFWDHEPQWHGIDRERGLHYMWAWDSLARVDLNTGAYDVAPAVGWKWQAAGYGTTAPSSAQLAAPHQMWFRIANGSYYSTDARQMFVASGRPYGGCVAADGKVWTLCLTEGHPLSEFAINRTPQPAHQRQWVLRCYDPDLLVYTDPSRPMPYGPGGSAGSSTDFWSDYRTPHADPQVQALVGEYVIGTSEIITSLPVSDPRRDPGFPPGQGYSMDFMGLAQSLEDPNVFYTSVGLDWSFETWDPYSGNYTRTETVPHFLKFNVSTGVSEIVGVDNRITVEPPYEYTWGLFVAQIVVGPGPAPELEDVYLDGRRRFT